LHLVKDTNREQLDNFTMRRIEQLRETIVRALDWIDREGREALQPVQKAARYGKVRNGAVGAKKTVLEKRT
jgi:hypothetical protein